jgi:hypothetical protein
VADGGWRPVAGWGLAAGDGWWLARVSGEATCGVPVMVADPVRHINATLGHTIAYFARKIQAQRNFLGTIAHQMFRVAQSFQDLFELCV